MFDILIPTLGLFGMITVIVFLESRRRKPCPHLHTRCIHGDEITQRMKVHFFRLWKTEVIYRQTCKDCGALLERSAICTATGEDLHDWEGPWPYDE